MPGRSRRRSSRRPFITVGAITSAFIAALTYGLLNRIIPDTLADFVADQLGDFIKGIFSDPIHLLILVGIVAFIVAFITIRQQGRIEGRTEAREFRSSRAPSVSYAGDEQLYLQWLKKDVEGRLRTSIHGARLIDLELTEELGATLPWTYSDYKQGSESEQFSDFKSAFEHYNRRVLLLGAPGAGKTTTLLHLTLNLIPQNLDDTTSRIPLKLDLSRWTDIGSFNHPDDPLQPARLLSYEPLPRRRETSASDIFADWLISEASSLPGVSEELATNWVTSGRVALLLDSLDEVIPRARGGLMQAITDYAKRYIDMPMVVCSRITDYDLIRADFGPMGLDGAVRLKPLTDEQILDYLGQAGATGLREALPDDKEMFELARTPLILSMMTLAYGKQAPTKLSPHESIYERRRALFDFYVDRMMQREVRRRADEPRVLPESISPYEDYPTPYTRREADHYLGWIATVLVERSASTFKLRGLYHFLMEKQSWTGWGLLNTVNSLVIFLFCAFTTWLVLLQSNSSFEAASVWALLIALTSAIWYWASFYIDVQIKKRVRVRRRVQGADLIYWVANGLRVLAILTLLFGCCVTLAGNMPFHLGSLTLLVVPDTYGISQSSSPDGLTVWTYIGLPVGGALVTGLLGFVTFSVLSVILNWPDVFRERTIKALRSDLSFLFSRGLVGLVGGIVLGGISGLLCVPTYALLGDATGPLACAIFLGMSLTLWELRTDFSEYSLAIIFHVVYVAAMLLSIFIGAKLGGPIVALAAGLLVNIPFFWAVEKNDKVFPRLESIIFDPVVMILLFLTRTLPIRLHAFMSYSVGCLLLQRSGDGYSFVHLMLRDHFALSESQTTSNEPYFWLGQSQLSEERYLAAVESFGRALESNPKHEDALYKRGETFRLLGRYDEALADLDRALELNPDNAQARNSRGQTYLQLGRYDEALVDLNRADELDPDNAWTVAGRGEIYRIKREYRLAITDLNRAIELRPNYQWAIASRGHAYRRLGQYDKALADFNHAIKLTPNYVFALGGRGQTYRQLKQYDKALADLDRALELDPGIAWISAERAELMIDLSTSSKSTEESDIVPPSP